MNKLAEQRGPNDLYQPLCLSVWFQDIPSAFLNASLMSLSICSQQVFTSWSWLLRFRKTWHQHLVQSVHVQVCNCLCFIHETDSQRMSAGRYKQTPSQSLKSHLFDSRNPHCRIEWHSFPNIFRPPCPHSSSILVGCQEDAFRKSCRRPTSARSFCAATEQGDVGKHCNCQPQCGLTENFRLHSYQSEVVVITCCTFFLKPLPYIHNINIYQVNEIEQAGPKYQT